MRDKIFYQLWLLEIIRKSEFREILKEVGLYCGQDEILRYIRKYPGCKQIDIANFFKCTPASIATSTKRLESAGFLRKESSPDSLREKCLYLTQKGEEACVLVKQKVINVDEKLLNNISEEDKEHLRKVLDQFIYNVSGKETSEVDIQEYISKLQEDKNHGAK